MCDPIPEFPLHEHNFYVRDTKFRPYKVKEGMVFIFLEYAIDNGSRQAVKVETRSFQPMRDESESEDPDVELLKQITDGIFKVGDEIKISGSIIFTAYYKADTKQLKYAPTLRIKSFRAGRASYSMPSRVRIDPWCCLKVCFRRESLRFAFYLSPISIKILTH
jgi:hypothetical protein